MKARGSATRVEFRERLRACWYVLRGWSVLHGVSVYGGEVSVRGNLSVSRGDSIVHCEVWTDGPVAFGGEGTFTGNSGSALTPQALARQDQDEARVRAADGR